MRKHAVGHASVAFVGCTERRQGARTSAAHADASDVQLQSGTSPLWLVTQEPALNALVTYLDAMRQQIAARPGGPHVLTFSRGNLDAVRRSFDRMIRRGENTLHQLCELLCSEFFDGRQLMHSVVVGEAASRDRFTLVQSLTRDDLRAQTDLDLGTRQLQRVRYRDGHAWRSASLIANFVEYQPVTVNRFNIHKLISRIKAEEQIWNKVVDGLFGLERLVRLDKQLSHLSAYVKDVFAVKAVVADASAARNVHRALLSMAWTRAQLESRGILATPDHRRLQLVEIKDYLSRSAGGRKRSGWGAIKSVVRWGGTMLEIQVQPMTNYHRERERLTRESHAGFKAQREELRHAIAVAQPLFGFYHDLLRWLFMAPTEQPPRFPSVRIVVLD